MNEEGIGQVKPSDELVIKSEVRRNNHPPLKLPKTCNYQMIRSKKGFDKLALDGYQYNLDKRQNNHSLWRCELSKKPGFKCRGRVRMSEEGCDVYNGHSHPPDQRKVEADMLKARLYAAAEDPTNSSKSLYDEALNLANHAATSALDLPKIGSMQRVISRKRRNYRRTVCSYGGSSSSVSDGVLTSSFDPLHNSLLHNFLFSSQTELDLQNDEENGETLDVTDGFLENINDTEQKPYISSSSILEACSLNAVRFLESKNKRMEIINHFQNVANETGFADLTSYDLAEALDNADPLRRLRELFHYPKMSTIPNVDHSLVNDDDDCIYMCGNSLGLLPKATKYLMNEQFDKWAKMGVFGHREEPLPWAHSDEAVAGKIAELIGAEASEVALMNSLTVNLHLLLTAFYKPTSIRHKVLIESQAFPSDHYAVESQIRLRGYSVEESLICVQPREGQECLDMDDILALIDQEGDSIAVIWFNAIHYFTGQLFDIKAITEAGHRKGCLVGWDLAHAFANIPLTLHDWDVDFACWCTYKYGCSGAGGIGAAFVHSKFNDDNRERMLGWWGHKFESRFQMDNVMDLSTGAAGYRISNPPMMLMVPIVGFLHVMSKTSINDLRTKSILLTGYLEHLINHFLSASSLNRRTKRVCTIITPSDPEQRGCQLSLKFSISIDDVYKELVKRGVAVDIRHPNVIRVTPVHLYNSFTDVHRFMRALLDSLQVVEAQYD